MKNNENGYFIISLDFELHWGAVEKWNLGKKKKYFDDARKSIPLVLDLFEEYNIHATWATVGFLFAKNKDQLVSFFPKKKPTYKNNNLSTYNFLSKNRIGNCEAEDPYHFAGSLISKIISTPNQEIASHTFSHYYCNEKGQDLKQFEDDLKAAQKISKENFGIELKSLVFPRNQFNSDYLSIAKQNGIKIVRSNPNVWFWKTSSRISPVIRAFDTLMAVSCSLSFNKTSVNGNEILKLPSSRFLRPYSHREKFIQNIKLRRVKSEMTYAANKNRVYHLWWHPHNFGNSLKENLFFLEEILKHYKYLNKTKGFSSSSMLEMYN